MTTLAQQMKVEPPQSLKDQMELVVKRARKYRWPVRVDYVQRETYILGVASFTRPAGQDEEKVVVRFKYVPHTDSIRFASADRHMRSSPTDTKAKLATLRDAIGWMKDWPQPRTARTVRAATTKQGDTKEMATATTTKRLKIKKAATATPTKATKATSNGKTAAATDREKRDAALTTKVVSMRKKGMGFGDIAAELDIPAGKARILMLRHEAGPAESATPAKVKKDRDQGAMGWAAIAAKYGLRKAGVVKLYKEAGGDMGGKPAAKAAKAVKATKADAAPKATRAVKKAAAKEANAAEAASAKSLFANDTDKDLLIEKLNGKRIVFTMSEKYGGGLSEPTRVKDGTIKVGDQKNGVRVIQFNDGDKSRVVAATAIVKVLR